MTAQAAWRGTGRLPAPVIEQVKARVDGSRERIVSFTQKFLGFKTESQDPENPSYLPETQACQAWLEEYLRGVGCLITRWNARPATFPAHPVLAATLEGSGDGPSVALNGHIDVVPVGDTGAWTYDPWGRDIADGLLYGRGACDMKGGVAAMLLALEVLRDLGFVLKGDVHVHLVSDEEVVGWGSRECVEKLPRPDAVIDTEPTGLAVVPVEGGLVHVRIELEGREAHAGSRWASIHAGGRGEGVNAVEKGVKIVTAVQELERIWANEKRHDMFPPGFNSLLPGIFISGPGGGLDGRLNMITNPGTHANYCSIEYNIWYYPFETFEQIRDEFETYVLTVCQLDPWLREHPPRFTWKLRNVFFPPAETPADHPFVAAVADAVEAAERTRRLQAFTAVADLAWYGEKGIPGVLLGPGNLAQAHSPNEYVPIDELVDCTKVIALTLLGWCGYAARR